MNAPDRTRIAWNDPEILIAAGTTPDAVRALLRANNQPEPTDFAVYQWTSRRRIPDRWRPALVYSLMRTNKLSVTGLFRRGSAARVRTDYDDDAPEATEKAAS